jgi:large subunit ribosomal protein L17
MRHRMDNKRLNRTTSHRRAMRRNMAAALLQHGAIRTTTPKAKDVRRFVERLITLAKKGTLHARRRVLAELTDRDLFTDDGDIEEKTLVQKLFEEIAPRFADRPGGYTRIIKLAERRLGDAGEQVVLQLVEEDADGSAGGGSSRRKDRAVKLYAAAEAVAPAATAVAEAPAEEADAEDAPAEDAADAAGQDAAAEDAPAEEGDEEKAE